MLISLLLFIIHTASNCAIHAHQTPNLLQQLQHAEFSYTEPHQLPHGVSIRLATAPPPIQNPMNHPPPPPSHEIPKIIWTFWDRPDMPHLITRCLANWRFFNPDYEIHLISLHNLHLYIDTPPPNFFHKSAFTAQFQSDWVRLELLSRYGGIWIDASTLFLGSLEWVHRMQSFENRDGVVFYVNDLTRDLNRPVIENWFIAATPTSPFIQAWRQEYHFALDHFANGRDYAFHLKKIHSKHVIEHATQGVGANGYLMQHIAALKLMFVDEVPLNFVLLDSLEGPMHLLSSLKYQDKYVEPYVRKWTQLPMTEWAELARLQVPMIKLIGQQRRALIRRVQMDRRYYRIDSRSLYAQLLDMDSAHTPEWIVKVMRFGARLKSFLSKLHWNHWWPAKNTKYTILK